MSHIVRVTLPDFMNLRRWHAYSLLSFDLRMSRSVATSPGGGGPGSPVALRRKARARWLALCAAVSLSQVAGCTVRSLEDTEPGLSVNQCESSSNCPSGARCVDGRCLAESGAIETVLIEVVPPMLAEENDRSGSSISSVRYLTEQTLPERASDALNLELRPIVRVTGAVDLSGLESNLCSLSDIESLVIEARFTPSEQLLGLPSTTYTSTVEATSVDSPVEFVINVPPGYYDIYLKTTVSGGNCQAVPRLIRRKAIGVSSSNEMGAADEEPIGDVRLPLMIGPPSTLTVKVKWPGEESALQGWTLAMVDSSSGQLISGQEVLSDYPGLQVHGFRYAPVEYATGPAPEIPAETELLRLAPPENVVAPTLYAARVGLELFVANEAEISLKSLPRVVDVIGQVRLNDSNGEVCATLPEAADPGDGTPAEEPCAVPFSVQVVSSAGVNETSTFNDTIPKGIFATYQATVETVDDLRFYVSLPAGEYRAIAVPEVDDYRHWAIGKDTWVLSSAESEVHGKTVSVMPRARVEGQVSGAAAGTVTGFAVNMSASPAEVPSTILEVTRREAPVPRASSTALSEDGSFSIFADPGVFNLTVRPEAESGFAWLVRPGITITQTPEQRLDDMRLPVPVRYHGSIQSLSLGGRVPDALVRAYVYLDGDGQLTRDASKAHSVIQVGEARADAQGKYELLLPAELGR